MSDLSPRHARLASRRPDPRRRRHQESDARAQRGRDGLGSGRRRAFEQLKATFIHRDSGTSRSVTASSPHSNPSDVTARPMLLSARRTRTSLARRSRSASTDPWSASVTDATQIPRRGLRRSLRVPTDHQQVQTHRSSRPAVEDLGGDLIPRTSSGGVDPPVRSSEIAHRTTDVRGPWLTRRVTTAKVAWRMISASTSEAMASASRSLTAPIPSRRQRSRPRPLPPGGGRRAQRQRTPGRTGRRMSVARWRRNRQRIVDTSYECRKDASAWVRPGPSGAKARCLVNEGLPFGEGVDAGQVRCAVGAQRLPWSRDVGERLERLPPDGSACEVSAGASSKRVGEDVSEVALGGTGGQHHPRHGRQPVDLVEQ